MIDREALGERVARAMRDVYLSRQPKYSGAGNYPLEEFLPEADAAIDLAFEEAARACETNIDSEMDAYGRYFAAALRAYIKK